MCDVSKKIYNKRKELGLTLEEVGQAVGVGKSTVRKWETGMIKNMGRDKVSKLAKVLNIPATELVPGGPEEDFTEEEIELIRLYRMAEDSAKEYAKEMLVNHPKKDSEASAI